MVSSLPLAVIAALANGRNKLAGTRNGARAPGSCAPAVYRAHPEKGAARGGGHRNSGRAHHPARRCG